ncbi:MAG: hypothetical protein ABIY55_10080, partial [Kofleriaceae bacterium]
NRTVRKITPAGLVSTLAGTAGIDGSTDGKGPLARFSDPFGTAVDSAGNVWVTDGVNATIRRITAAGVTTTLAGVAGMHSTVDGVGATARLNTPYGIALDAAGNAYVTDIGAHVLRQLAADGTLTTLAGTAGVSGHADGPGLAASFSEPVGVAVGGDGTIYVADFGNHTIRKVTPAGVVTTIAGSAGTPGSADGAGAEARFDNPVGVAVDARNNLYVLDLGNTVVRKITPAGVTTTIAGTPGVRGLTLGGSPQFALPQAIALSGDSLIITDANAVLILRHAAQ